VILFGVGRVSLCWTHALLCRGSDGCCRSLSGYRRDLGAAVVVGLPQGSCLVSEKTVNAAVVCWATAVLGKT